MVSFMLIWMQTVILKIFAYDAMLNTTVFALIATSSILLIGIHVVFASPNGWQLIYVIELSNTIYSLMW